MASNPYVNRVETADGTAIIDISDTTAVASDVAQGKFFYTAAGAKTAGTASGVTQANWDETDPDSPSYILNKPTIPSKTSDLTNDSGYLTSSDVQEITSAQITSIIATIDTTGGWTRASGVNF